MALGAVAPAAWAQGASGSVPSTAPQSARPADAAAGAAGAAPTTQLGEVIVTARKREENLQNVPVQATVLSGATLAQQNVVDISNIGLTVPSFKISVAPAEGSSVVVQIRGQVQPDNVSTEDPSVGIYVDGVYWSRPTGADAALADISSVQVLEGPQGTLFGRNTTGGALVINTNDPSLTHYSGLATLTGGSYNELDSGLVLNAPIIEDKLALRAVYYHNSHDGYDYDTTTDKRVNSQDNTTIRLKLLAQPTDKLRILLSYENFDIDQRANPLILTYVQPTGFANVFSEVLTGQPLTQYETDKTHSTGENNDLLESVHTQTASGTTSYDLGFGVLKDILAYRKVDNLSDEDVVGTPLSILTEQTRSRIEEFTNELQITGKLLGNKLDYAAGYYWFYEKGRDGSVFNAFPGLNPDNPQIVDGDIANRSQAGYGQGTYRITDTLSITGGLRYSADHKALISKNGVFTPGGFACSVPIPQSPTTCAEEFGSESSDVDYTASLEYKLSPNILGYVKVSHGYRAGGDQLRGSTLVSYTPFQPETALNYEAGLKSEYLDHRIRLNLTGYYTDYKNIQRTITIAGVDGGTATTVANAAAGKIYGGEFETQAVLTPNLRVGATFSATEASYDTYMDLLGNHSEEPFPFVPEFQYSLTGDYTHDVPRGRVNLHADWGWQSSVNYAAGYTDGGTTSPLFPVSSVRQGPYGLLNMRIAYDIADPNLEVALFGRNVANKQYRQGTVDLVNAGVGVNTAQYGAPATFGVQVTYKFGG